MSGEIRLTESVTLQMLQQILNVTCGSIFGEKKQTKRVTEKNILWDQGGDVLQKMILEQNLYLLLINTSSR